VRTLEAKIGGPNLELNLARSNSWSVHVSRPVSIVITNAYLGHQQDLYLLLRGENYVAWPDSVIFTATPPQAKGRGTLIHLVSVDGKTWYEK
jgi:hypothetical protein